MEESFQQKHSPTNDVDINPMNNLIQYDKYKHERGCNTTAAVSTLEVNNMNEFETEATKQNKIIANSMSSSNIVS